MKVGSIGYATDQGLGYLLKQFYDNGVVNSVYVVRHGRRETHDDWFPGSPQLTDIKSMEQVRKVYEWVKGLDVLLCFETPFIWELFEVARRAGVRTVLMPMYECMPKVLPDTPDVFLNPSLLDQQYYPNGIHIPVPADSTIEWKPRGKITTFVHNAGHGGLKGRNGTKELVDAWKLVKSPAKLLVRSQSTEGCYRLDNRMDWIEGTVPREELYLEGECFIFPEKFNGLSLPLQEALASGMVVMATRRFPNTTYLPPEPLIPVSGHRTSQISVRTNDYQEAIVQPQDIAAKIDELYGRDSAEFSEYGRMWAQENSWEVLKPRYLEVLRG